MSEIIAGTYEKIQKLGAGGGGNVYLANHLRLNKKIVLKADKRVITTKSELLRREVDVLKDLKHPRIPQVYDYFVEGDTVYTVMDYVQGESLDRALKRGEHFSQAQVIEWAMQLLDALDYLHSPIHGDPPRGFIHSDIKPANLMLLPDNSICLIDFNIALALGEENVIGRSAGYASPEHYGISFEPDSDVTDAVHGMSDGADDVTEAAALEDVTEAADVPTPARRETARIENTSGTRIVVPDVRSDIYSVGATLYHLLSGVRPAHSAMDVVPLSPKEFSPQVAAIIRKAMDPVQSKRYQTAAEMLSAFRDLRKNDPRQKRLRRCKRVTGALYTGCFVAGMLLSLTGLKRMQLTERWLHLAADAQQMLAEGNREQALTQILQAFPEKKTVLTPEYVPQAQEALTHALGVYELADSYQPQGVITLPSAPLQLRLSPDGKTAACVYSGMLRLTDTHTLETLVELPMDPSGLAEVEFLDADRVVYAGPTGLTAYSLSRAETLWTGKPATAICLSQDGKTVAGVYKAEPFATVYDAETGAPRTEISFGESGQRVAENDLFANPEDMLLALSPDGAWLATSFADGTVRLYDTAQPGQPIVLLPGDTGAVEFSGGFYQHYFAFTASGKETSVFVVVDVQTMEQTGGFQSEYAFHTQVDDTGIYLQTENILVRLDPVTGEQRPLVTTPKGILSFASRAGDTVISTADTFAFFNAQAAESASYKSLTPMHFSQIGGGVALLGSRDVPAVRVLHLQDGAEYQLLHYDPEIPHTEARLSADGETVMLFDFQGFTLYAKDGSCLLQQELPHPEQIHDQQFRREDGRSYLEVLYRGGQVLCYDARDGALLAQEQQQPPDPTMEEEFLTDQLRFVSVLHGAPEVYDRESGKLVAQLDEDAYLTYVTQTEQGVVAQFITADGLCYGVLYDAACVPLARLPYLCDVAGDMLIFDYPSGEIRSTRIWNITELLEFAKTNRKE